MSQKPSKKDDKDLEADHPGKPGTIEEPSPTHTTENVDNGIQHQEATEAGAESRESTPPPLPPRPKLLQHPTEKPTTSAAGGLRLPSFSLRPRATTALSSKGVEVHSNSPNEKSTNKNTAANARLSPISRQASRSNLRSTSATRRESEGGKGSEGDDTSSIRSLAPTLGPAADVESLLGEALLENEITTNVSKGHDTAAAEEPLFPEDKEFEAAFADEFNELEEMDADEALVRRFRSKLKHFLILSSAGKPIYSRHGDDQLISNYMGVLQTLISFYQGSKDELRGFHAHGVRFVIVTKGPLYLVAISRLDETDAQLRSQLDSLYMQILSTLTLPSLEKMFRARASTDLRRPLQGTDKLLSALADGFTRGSPSTLLSALECLKLRKSQRQLVNATLLKTRVPSLLYGLIVANGRLVSVVRPKKHSLHPGDLHLIFNMLFEAKGVKAGDGGENWVPLCLPGFNNTGFLYMYVSFVETSPASTEEKQQDDEQEDTSAQKASTDDIAIIFISANREGFFELSGMKKDLVSQMSKNGTLECIRRAVRDGRQSCTDIVPGTPLRHFLYKSRGNVQFCMPSYEPWFRTEVERRRLMTLYAHLHATLHSRPTALKIHHTTSHTHTSLAWSTPHFELYTIAPRSTSRAALAQAANKVIQWVRREEERVFIIGGAVF